MIQWGLTAGIQDIVASNRANRDLLRFMRDTGEGGLAWQVVAHGVLRFQGEAQTRSPYLTGTLAFAHTGEVYDIDGGAEGRVYIDPSIVNPVFGGRPAEYGIDVHQRKPWFDNTFSQEGETILNEMLAMAADLAVEVWR